VRKWECGSLWGAAIGALALGLAASADAAERVRWKMQSTFGGSLVHLGESGVRFSKTIETISQGDIQIRFFEPGALVPALQAFDAVSNGSVDASWTTAGYHVGKIPAIAFFTAVPFGPSPGEFLGWMYHGGGLALKDELYGEFNVKALNSVMIAPEASGWFRREIKSADELRGVKMRFFGLGAKVVEKLGVSTQLLAGGDIYPALELGTIDATEFSMPDIDMNLGFHQVAKHYYFPGWHQQTSVNEFLMHKPHWDKLSDHQKLLIETTLKASVLDNYVASDSAQGKALAELQKKGVTLHFWPQETLDKLEAAWREVLAEESAKDPKFKKVAESYSAWRDQYDVWRKHGYLRN
jgi:TRAP-type mannitol/chloroaromatic compound transport system substrate-binding protein